METATIDRGEVATRRLLVGAAVAVFAICVLRTAWVGDDAFITLRTVDNFVQGFGLRYNVAERVQSYTHPLWMLLLSIVYRVTGEPFYGTLALSFVTSLAAVWLLAFRVAQSTVQALLALFLLCASRAFIDYSTSGLENPLTHLFVVLFALSYLGARDELSLEKRLLHLSVLAGLMALNRQDSLLLPLPALVQLSWLSYKELGPKSTVRTLLLGFSPWLAWLAFSLLYYGFLVPNTAFAKLNTGVSLAASVQQGLIYLIHTIAWDPATIAILLAGALLFFSGLSVREKLFALGAWLHIAYVIRIGGDYMAGRFLTVAVLMSVCLIARHRVLTAPRIATVFAIPILFALFISYEGETWPSSTNFKFDGISDERGMYRKHGSLMLARRSHRLPDHPRYHDGEKLARSRTKVELIGPAGYLGFAAGPDVHLVDYWGLADPLLARLPDEEPENFRIGHFKRIVPEGYLDTLRTGRCKMSSAYCKYYREIERIVRGPIGSWDRFVSIAKMNVGAFDHLLELSPKEKAKAKARSKAEEKARKKKAKAKKKGKGKRKGKRRAKQGRKAR